ncbi:MAG: hypothetical protein GX977_08215 [Firmicutes bacterium]|jgi:hypothetical protein|nr:hypothetical protein [Bacillota bacterium]
MGVFTFHGFVARETSHKTTVAWVFRPSGYRAVLAIGTLMGDLRRLRYNQGEEMELV